MCNWITAVLISAISWGSADTMFDTIVETDSEEDHQSSKKTLTHTQTMLLCAATTYFILFLYGIFILSQGTDYLLYLNGKSMFFLYDSNQDLIILILSGIFSYYHYHFIVNAFEHSSSTIILPFLQFSSVFAFLLSIIQKTLSSKEAINNYMHILAYFLILIGGLTPATDGKLLSIFKPNFWKQGFVKYAIAADGSHAIYTVLVSFVGNADSYSTEFNFFQNMEFFFLTRVLFVGTFLFQLVQSKQMQRETIQITTKSPLLIISTIVCEILTLIGYFTSVYSYQCYYQVINIHQSNIIQQPGVVSAAESSLNLIVNLFLAYFLKRYFKVGRNASERSIALKLLACVIISIGLIIANT